MMVLLNLALEVMPSQYNAPLIMHRFCGLPNTSVLQTVLPGAHGTRVRCTRVKGKARGQDSGLACCINQNSSS